MNRIIFIGSIGSDAGGWYVGADGKIHRIPGWNPEQLVDFSHAVTALRAVSQIKLPGTEQVTSALHQLVTKGLGSHVKEGDVVVLG